MTRAGVVSQWLDKHGPWDLVVHGGATGVDAEAQAWVDIHKGVQAVVFPYQKPLGIRGGPSRNGTMCDVVARLWNRGEHHVRCVFVPDDKSRGTWDCHREALELCLPSEVLE
jgi:hypothetical protein